MLSLSVTHKLKGKESEPWTARNSFLPDIPIALQQTRAPGWICPGQTAHGAGQCTRNRAGSKQLVSLSFDGRFITVAANGKKQRFDLPGITYWLTISAFGGRENNRFGGVLYSISTKHFADK